MEDPAMLVRRIARPLLSVAFIAEGASALRNTRRRAEQAAPLIQASEQHLPPEVSARVPSNPETLVRINAAAQIGGGILLALGRAPRLASVALTGSFIPTTISNDAFWDESDPTIRAAKRADFLKNLSLLGGLTIAAVDTEGKPSLGWRGRRALRHASTSIAAAVPMGTNVGNKAGKRMRYAAHVAAERSQELGEAALEGGTRLADVTLERAPAIAHEARERGAKIAGIVRERGGELAESAKNAAANRRAS